MTSERAEDSDNVYDVIAPTYDQVYRDSQSQAEDRWVSRLIRQQVGNRWVDVLDLGCGTGWFLDHLQDVTRGYLGIDSSQGMLDQFWTKHPLFLNSAGRGIRRVDLNTPWFLARAQDFDLVVSTYCSPSHAADPGLLLRRCYDVLRPGGQLFLMPSADGSKHRRRLLPAEAYQHDIPWHAADAEQWVDDAGFTDIELHGLRHPTLGPSNAHRAARLQDAWLRLERQFGRHQPDEFYYLTIQATKPGPLGEWRAP